MVGGVHDVFARPCMMFSLDLVGGGCDIFSVGVGGHETFMGVTQSSPAPPPLLIMNGPLDMGMQIQVTRIQIQVTQKLYLYCLWARS